MDREKMLKIALGYDYIVGRDFAVKVLDYISEHPFWNRGEGEKPLYKNSVLTALSNAVSDIYGHSLDYYISPCRKRQMVDIRQMAIYIFRKETKIPTEEIGKIFGRNHASVIYACLQVESHIRSTKGYKNDFEILEKTFKNYLYEEN